MYKYKKQQLIVKLLRIVHEQEKPSCVSRIEALLKTPPKKRVFI